jgi:alpha-glucosidase
MPEGVLGFVRETADEALACIFNMRENPAIVPLPGDLVLKPLELPFDSPEPAGGALSLGPFGAYIGTLEMPARA